MANVLKIDSNGTGLRFAAEETIGVLPAEPVWKPLEPNSYDKFGGEIKTVARNPINDGRQRKKGVVVDLDAAGGFEIDITADNTQDLMEGFLFASARRKAELLASSVDVSGVYNVDAGADQYYAGNLLFAKNYSNATNNGLSKVSASTTTTVTTDNVTGEEDGAATGTISRVGHEFASGTVTIDVSGDLPKMVVSGVTAASRVLTATLQFLNAETVTIGSKVYTFQTALTNVDGNVKIGASLAASLLNLRNAINRNNIGVAGTDFATATTAHPDVVAVATGTTLTATAKVAGTTGNALVTTTTATNATWAGSTLSGGAGRSLFDLGLTVGEWVNLGDDATANKFVNPENNGLKRVRVIENNALTFDKSTLAMVTDAGTGKLIRMIFGRVIKNEVGALVKRFPVQFERTLGAPDDSDLAAVQSEYLVGAIPNEFTMSIKTADKLTAKLGYMARDNETRTAAEGLKPGLRPVLQESDAFNSSSHVARLSLALVDPLTANPVDLFAFLLDCELTINNNVKANKAIKYLGAFDNSAGTFEVDAKMTAYFATVEAIRAVRANSDVTLDLTFSQANKGITIDLPLVSIATEGADVKQDEAIMLPITSAAATASKLDPNLNHTMLIQYWDYLPTLAA